MRIYCNIACAVLQETWVICKCMGKEENYIECIVKDKTLFIVYITERFIFFYVGNYDLRYIVYRPP